MSSNCQASNTSGKCEMADVQRDTHEQKNHPGWRNHMNFTSGVSGHSYDVFSFLRTTGAMDKEKLVTSLKLKHTHIYIYTYIRYVYMCICVYIYIYILKLYSIKENSQNNEELPRHLWLLWPSSNKVSRHNVTKQILVATFRTFWRRTAQGRWSCTPKTSSSCKRDSTSPQ